MPQVNSMRETAVAIVRRLQEAGFESYFVGGCVRDQLRGREPTDYDIATAARPSEIESLFKRTIPVGRAFGVVIVVEDRRQFQTATFRSESDYGDGRHPGRVSYADAVTDARRRDFTINGLFLDPVRGELHDWVGGQADLKARLLRTIGDPRERFTEDHLRLLRAARFAAQLDFVIESETLAALRERASTISGVSAERIRDELIKLLRPPHAARGLELLRETGLMEFILPEILATIGCEQSADFHPEGSVYNHVLKVLEQLPENCAASLPWAALLHDVGKPATASRDADSGQIHFYGHESIGGEIAESILRRLKFPRRQIDEIVACVRQHMQFKDVLNMRKSTLRRLLMRGTFPLELELHRLDCLGSHGRLDHYAFLIDQSKGLNEQPAILPTLVTGRDVIALGLKPGPRVGSILDEVREKQLQDELQTREEALDWIRRKLEGV